ncbi:MAG: amidohydrolase family protein [Planctomycetota bacterium]|jgi:predicted TIM-barrel fold metal-dependent hydrolase
MPGPVPKPIIDVHAHLINAMDIPLKGFFLSRSPESLLQRLLLPLLAPFLARCLRRKLDPPTRAVFLNRILCETLLKVAQLALGKEMAGWGDTLSKTTEAVTEELFDTYGKDRIDLHVPLLLDYEYWFENTPDRLMKDQIDHLATRIVLPHEGRIHPFVAFDPARELAFRKGLTNPDGHPEEHGALNLVKEAVEKKGFIGVKLYNAMGYRPFNNRAVEREREGIPMHKSKYRFTGEEYDEVLSDCYRYCVENEVPITAHCFMDGMESYKDASWDFGQAVFWREVLDQEAFRDLRLNLAHFGWNKAQRYDGNRCWVTDICEMFADYPHLYADVGHHRVIVEEKKVLFQEDYKAMCARYPLVKERLLFGIDWHIVKRVRNYPDFLRCYLDVLQGDALFSEEEIADFLGGNALRFLGLTPGGKNRERLRAFYRTHGINPPAWFEGLEGS